IEAAYINLGTLKYAVTGTEPSFFGGGTSNVSLDADFRTKGPALAAVGRLPMSNLWELDARLGAFAAKTRSRYSTTVDASANSGSES
ncbi:hypothetical protein, partial [Klebsiella pneumoniae]|uniref:hypothetical protein n=1 Tax=Klebsiella pneumoniae TaxID=573 RepID=UPI003855669C